MNTQRYFTAGIFATLCLLMTSAAALAADTRINGTVILSGKPLDGGKIVLHLKSGEFLGVSISRAGTYAFQQLSVPPGKYVVTISGTGVPAKYGEVNVSPLLVEVKEGENTFDFDLN